jgi:hypothetical protein
MSDLIGGT